MSPLEVHNLLTERICASELSALILEHQLSIRVSYFNNLSDLESRKFSFEEKHLPYTDFKPKLFIMPSELKSLMNKLYKDLKHYSKGEYIEYEAFIRYKGDPVENAYLLSFLISEGLVDVKVNRLEEKVWIKPLKFKKELVNPSSLAMVIQREEREKN